MTPRSLFNIVLKIFGILLLRDIFFTSLQLATSFSFLQKQYSIANAQESYQYFTFIYPLFRITIGSLISYLLIFKANIIIDKLSLDKGFDQDEFSLNFSSSQILTIILILIGGITIIDEIPNFCNNVFSFFQNRSLTHGTIKPNYSFMIISSVKIIIGFLVIGERRRITELIKNDIL